MERAPETLASLAQIELAAKTLAALARIPSLQPCIAVFRLERLDAGPRWYKPGNWTGPGYLDHITARVPVDHRGDRDMLLARCRLEIKHGLERLAVDLATMRRFDPDGSKFPEFSVLGLLATAERYLEAMDERRVPA